MQRATTSMLNGLALAAVLLAHSEPTRALDCSRNDFEIRPLGATTIQIALAWAPVLDATAYIVERGVQGSSTCSAAPLDASYTLKPFVNAYGDTGRAPEAFDHFFAPSALSVQGTYCYRVRAVLADGELASHCVENQHLLRKTEARPRGAAGDLWADVVLGKPDFGQNASDRTSEHGYEGAGGVLIDRTHTPNRMYIGDTNHNRILGFDHLGQCENGPTPGQDCTTDSDCGAGGACVIGFGRHCVNQPQLTCTSDRDCPSATDTCALDPETVLPAIVLGQPSFRDQSACNGDGTGQRYPDRAPAGPGTLCLIDPTQISMAETVFAAHMAVDDQGALYVADLFNHRVLKYDDPFVSQLADDVWGQTDFSANLCNRGNTLPDNTTLCFSPREHGGIAIDADGSLWVADTGNSRALRFPKVGGTIQHGADLVLGQPSFTSRTLGGQVRPLDQFAYPMDVAFFNGKLYVADTSQPGYWGGSRVLEFAPPFSSHMAGSALPITLPCNQGRRCDGNSQFSCTTDADCQAHSACNGTGCCTTGTRPMDLAMDTKRNGLWVQNLCGYSELLDLDTTPTTIVPGPVPSNGPLAFADGIDVDSDGNVFMVNKWGDTYRFKRQGLDVDNLGPRETVFAGGSGPSASSAYIGKGVTIHGDQLIFADRSRLLIWNDFLPDTLSVGVGNPVPLGNGQPADDQYGESSLTSAWHRATQMFFSPQASSDKLWVEQFSSWTNRLLVFDGRLSNSPPPPTVIPLTQQQPGGTFAGFPVAGCPGAPCCTCPTPGAACNGNNVFALQADEIDFAVSPSGSEVWVADRNASRVFRIVDLDSNPTVDVVLGQHDLGGTSCTNGQAGLCFPYHVTLDPEGNLYISDNGGETGTNRRILEFDAGALPAAPAAQVTCGLAATRALGTAGPSINPFKPTLHRNGALLVTNNSYALGSYPTVYLYPLANWTPPQLILPQLVLGDMLSYPVGSQLFDDFGNLYLSDSNWSRLLIYEDPLRRLRFGPYRNTVVADIPAAYFRLGEAAGPTAIDASGNGNHATYSDTGITYGADALIGFDGDTAIQTDGVHGTMTVQLANQSAYTIEAWVKPEAGATTARNIITRTNNQANQWSQQLRISAGGLFEHYLFDGQDRVDTGSTPVVAGTTYHVVGTAVSNGSMHLYVNGVEEGAPQAIGTLWTQGTRYVLGSNAGPGGSFGHFKGSLDEVAIYDSALPPGRIQAHYNAAVQSPVPTPTWTPAPTPLPNVAVGQAATQSSTWGGLDASRAADGNINGSLAAGSVSVTNYDPQAWWQIDLGAVYPLTTINVWNRTDCCSERLATFYVFVSDVPFTSTSLATTLAQPGVSAYYTAGIAGAVTTIAVNRTGRYVRVQLSGTNLLQLAEVEVFAQVTPTPTSTYPFTPTPTRTPAPTRTWTLRPMPTGPSPNLAAGQPTTQSSTFEGNSASRAADGNTYGNLWAGSVSVTDYNAQAWWHVDLGAVFTVATINVWNRTDCCSERLADFYVFVSDEPFTSTILATTLAQPGVSAYYTAGVAGTVTKIAVNRTGRYTGAHK